jgi:hypothetical protein
MLLATALSAVVSASAALASGVSYSGNWPLTVTHSIRSNGAYCLTVTDDGSLGWPHSGEASLTSQVSGNLPYGTFQLIDHTIMVTMDQQGETQNAGLVFNAPASNGNIGKGVYEQVYGGEETDSGEVVFGKKGGC